METTIKPVFGYVRVSTDGQVTDGVSMAAQQQRIAAWCTANGYELAGLFTDAGISGKRADNRPELQRAIAAVTAAGGVLVVYSLSRLARSTRDTITIGEMLDKAGADLVSLSEKIDTTTAAGKMVFRMLAVLAEFERDQISERVSMAMAHKRGHGELIGRVPFGFDLAADGVHLVENENEQHVIGIIRDLRGQGLTYRAIAGELQDRGIAAKAGGKWHAKVIMSICKAAA